MDITNSIIHYRRSLKRRNYSPHTVKNYLNILQQYIRWLDVPPFASAIVLVILIVSVAAALGLVVAIAAAADDET